MSRDDILLEAEMSMEKSVDYMVHEFAAVRTGKASPGLVENVDVHAYGAAMKLKQLRFDHHTRAAFAGLFNRSTPARCPTLRERSKNQKIGITPAVEWQDHSAAHPGAFRRAAKRTRAVPWV